MLLGDQVNTLKEWWVKKGKNQTHIVFDYTTTIAEIDRMAGEPTGITIHTLSTFLQELGDGRCVSCADTDGITCGRKECVHCAPAEYQDGADYGTFDEWLNTEGLRFS